MTPLVLCPSGIDGEEDTTGGSGVSKVQLMGAGIFFAWRGLWVLRNCHLTCKYMLAYNWLRVKQ